MGTLLSHLSTVKKFTKQKQKHAVGCEVGTLHHGVALCWQEMHQELLYHCPLINFVKGLPACLTDNILSKDKINICC